MKVLYVLERYPELSQTFVAQELIGLQELGIEVEVVALQRGFGGAEPAPAIWLSEIGPAERLLKATKQVFTAPAATAKQLMGEQSWPPPAATNRLRGLARLSPALQMARSADHIHAHFATEAADIARLLSAASGKPFSFTAHASDAYSDPAALAVNIGASSFARGASEHVAQRLREATASPGKVIELPIAVDTSTFAETPRVPQPGRVLSVGRLVEKKGFSDLIAAFADATHHMPDAQLVIAGTGPLQGQLESEARASGANVSLVGSVTNSEVAQLMSTSSIFALTPKTAASGDRDGRPAVIIEAMAAGLPVLSTAQPGIPELVGKDCGLLADPGDVAQIALNLKQLLQLSDCERSAMGAKGIGLVSQTYGRAIIAQRLSTMFAAGLLSSSDSS